MARHPLDHSRQGRGYGRALLADVRIAAERPGAPPHKHTWSDEHFYILGGEITFLVGEEIKQGGKGDFVYVPRDTRHAFRVDSETAAFLNGYTPAGLELALAECAMPAPSRTIPPKGATPPPNMTDEQYRRYGMDNLPGPNPLAPDQN